jgi:hypothetical protein
MIYTGTSDQRHMAAYLDQLPADQYAAERLDRSLIELAGRVARGCIRGVVTAFCRATSAPPTGTLLRHLTAYGAGRDPRTRHVARTCCRDAARAERGPAAGVSFAPSA